MTAVKSLLDDFEKLIYQFLTWFVLIPKTFGKIVIDPDWVPGYVAKELDDVEKEKFDDYFSPILLFLLTTVVPFVMIQNLPLPGVKIVAPTEATINSKI